MTNVFCQQLTSEVLKDSDGAGYRTHTDLPACH